MGKIMHAGIEYGGGTGGTTVVANPTGEATANLSKLQVSETIYQIVGGGSGGGFNVDVLFDGSSATSLQASITLTAPWSNYDAIAFVTIEYYNNREYRHTNGIILKDVLQKSLESLSTNGGWVDIAVQSNSVYAFAKVESTTELTNIYGSSAIHHIDRIFGLTFGGGGSGGGTDVEANPTGTPTDELNTIRIGQNIYEIAGGGSGGGGSVEDLTDVNVTDVADGDILEYDSTAEKWKNSNALGNKVDKVNGKGLSTNDYTTAEKELVATIPDKADSDDISGSKNVTGNPIIIEDSANAYAEEVIANIEPIQDLHGYDHPWVGGAGKNLLPMTVEGIKTLNSRETWTGNSCTINGVTFTILTDSANNVIGIKAVGTATEGMQFRLADVPFKNGITYCISGAVSNPLNMNVTLFQKVSDSGGGVLYTSDTDENRRLLLYARSADIGKSVDVIFKPMVCVSNVIDTDFEPYENISPITGISQLNIVVSDHNIWDEDWELGIWNASGEKTASNSAIRCKNYINVIGGETYYVVCPYTSGLIVRELDSSKSVIKSTAVKNRTITLSASTKYVVICTFANDNIISYNNDVSFNYPSTITDYVPYRGHSLTISLGRTVYGGKLNIQTGELIVDMASVDLGSLNWTYSNGYFKSDTINSLINRPLKNVDMPKVACSAFKISYWNDSADNVIVVTPLSVGVQAYYVWVKCTKFTDASTFKTAVTGQTFVYELATPQTYHLTPEQVKLLKGYNYITTNADTLDITYQPDNVLGDILGEAEGYTDRAIASISDKGAEPITHSIDISSYTDDSNPYVAPEDGYIQLTFNSNGTGFIWMKIGFKRSSEARYVVEKYFRPSGQGDDFDAIFVKKGTYICLSSIQSYTNGYVYFRY